MIQSGNTISAVGLTVFILGAISLDSPGAGMYIAGGTAMAGLVLLYLGYQRRGGQEVEEKN